MISRAARQIIRRSNGSTLKLTQQLCRRPTMGLTLMRPFASQSAPLAPDNEHPIVRLRQQRRRTDAYIGLSGAQIFEQVVNDHEVKVMFGYPGGAILPVFDAIYESDKFKFILTRHEQGAGHMAQGYARATGKPGVVVVTSGPGATNVVTPMQDALMDGTPMVVFTGQVATSMVGTDAFQEADILGITRPCTKWNTQVRHVDDLARAINEAFHIATTGRPGPVLVDLPKDVTAAICQNEVCPEPELLGYYDPNNKVGGNRVNQSEALDRAAEMLNNAKRPLLFVGQGVIQAEACEELRALAKEANVPVATTIQGLGAFDERDPLSLLFAGMHGAVFANKAMQSADVILAVGARFDDRVTGRVDAFAPAARAAEAAGTGGIIHLDISAKQINKIVQSTVAVVGCAKHNLTELLPRVRPAARMEWHQQLSEWKREFPFRYQPASAGGKMKPQRVIEEFYTQTKDRAEDVFVTTGVGQHQMWAAQFYRWWKPRSLITSGGLGTMGFGLPAAIGAKIARPDAIVVDVDGDGSFSMTLAELATAAEFGVNVKVILLNNDFQGMVKQWQDLFYKERYSSTEMTNPDFVKVAEGFRVKGLRCESVEELPAIMAEMLACEGPVVAEFVVEKHEHCMPMVGAGKALDDMIIGDFDGCPPTTSL